MNEKEIMLAGDWHGDIDWALGMVSLTAEVGLNFIFHVGDFGIWPGDWGDRYLVHLENKCAEKDVTIFVTPGNHEDWDRIDAMEIAEDGLQWVSPHIALIPRGHRWEMNGRTFVSLGGAPSIDYKLRYQGRDWWPNEMITMAMAEKVAADGHAEIMLTHDSPSVSSKEVMAIINDPNGPNFWGEAGIAYAKEGRMTLDVAVAGVQPRLLVHGHFHVGGIGTDGHNAVVSLDQQRSKKNMMMLDLDVLAFDFVDPWAEWGKRAPVVQLEREREKRQKNAETEG